MTDYNPIAHEYRRAKKQPWRQAIESYTLMALVGQLDGLRVIDFACGEGYYSRLVRRGGADRVLGVDLSENMVALAKAEERSNPLGIEYLASDVCSLKIAEKFDLVVAAYLLNYARDEAELKAMGLAVRNALRPGGRFVTVNSNPELDLKNLPSYRAFGFDVHPKQGENPCEGDAYTWTFYLDEGPIQVENYWLAQSTHNRILADCGLDEITWHPPRVRESESDAAHWKPFLDRPPIAFLTCCRR